MSRSELQNGQPSVTSARLRRRRSQSKLGDRRSVYRHAGSDCGAAAVMTAVAAIDAGGPYPKGALGSPQISQS